MDDLRRFTTYMEQLHSTYFSVQFFQTSLSLIFLLPTNAKEDVSVSRDSPRLTALIQMFPLYFSYSRNSERLIPSMRNMAAQITLAFSFFLYNSLRQRIL